MEPRHIPVQKDKAEFAAITQGERTGGRRNGRVVKRCKFITPVSLD